MKVVQVAVPALLPQRPGVLSRAIGVTLDLSSMGARLYQAEPPSR
jgi:hypothetical protein